MKQIMTRYWIKDMFLNKERAMSAHFRSFVIPSIAVMLLFTSCAPMQLNSLPEPPPTAKLRVYVEAFTLGPAARHWGTPHEKYAKNQIIRTGKFLERTGIYEVVSDADVRTVVGDRVLAYDSMKSSDWSQARQIARALHADYVFVVASDKSSVGSGEWVMLVTAELVNVSSGRTFRSSYTISNITRADQELSNKLIRATYRDLFAQAKADMMAVAMQKGKAYVPSTEGAAGAPAVVAKKTPARPAVPETPEELSLNLPGTGLIEEPNKDRGAKRLVVYDLDSSGQYRTVALILAEALREELFKLKEFILVNREDLQKVLDEIALQQTGLIDEKQAVVTGRGLAANQIVTGKFGQLGKTFLMQAKRVDVETQATLGMSSTKFTEGQEDEVLNRLPGFARALAGLQ